MNDNDKLILEKIKKYAEQAVSFKENISFAEFSEDAKTTAACVFNLSQIGELVGRLSEDFTNTNTHVPWRKIRGMRNRIVHDYEGIQLNIVWDVLEDFLPELVKNIDSLTRG